MRGMIRFVAVIFGAFCMFFTVSSSWALTPEQVIALKNAGVSDETIRLMIRQEQEAAAIRPDDSDDSPGRKEITGKDDKTVIIYSIGRRKGNNQRKEEMQADKAWEMLNTLILDTRKSR